MFCLATKPLGWSEHTQVKRVIMKEPRFEALRREGERKKCWNAWKPQRAKDEREEQRIALQQNRERLKELMLMIDEITPRSKYIDVKSLLKDHQVFKSLKADRDRQVKHACSCGRVCVWRWWF